MLAWRAARRASGSRERDAWPRSLSAVTIWETASARGACVGASTSYPFDIAPDLYRRPKYDALAYFYHNRSGTPIAMPYAGAEACVQANRAASPSRKVFRMAYLLARESRSAVWTALEAGVSECEGAK